MLKLNVINVTVIDKWIVKHVFILLVKHNDHHINNWAKKIIVHMHVFWGNSDEKDVLEKPSPDNWPYHVKRDGYDKKKENPVKQ